MHLHLHKSNDAPPIMELHHVSVACAGRLALCDLTLRVEAGEHLAIMGPNGAGKSTLIRTIARELYPIQQNGSYMSLFGRESWDLSELRSTLGIVNSDLSPFYSRPITGRDVVLSGFFNSIGLWRYQQIKPEMWETTDQVLAWLEISHLGDRVVHQMSTGELRRLIVGRALVHNPRTLLLDEPSNSLDAFAQLELRKIVRKLAQSGVAILLITHHLADVIPEIKRILFLSGGRIVKDGAKAKLLTPKSLSSLFGCRVQVVKHDGYYHMVS